jgi:hypothetical protein
MQELQKVSKEEIDDLNARLVELQEEREASRAHRKQQIAVLEEQQEAQSLKSTLSSAFQK